jgi:transglutaminase-like putative cysteine protease
LVRSVILFVLVAALVRAAWVPLEQQRAGWDEVLTMIGLAAVPAVVYGLWRRWFVAAAALLVTTVFAASAAFEISVTEAQPRDPQHDFFGPVLDGIRQGFLDFYDTELPFNRLDFQLMHSVVLLAIFGFVALAGIFIVARRPVLAALAVVGGVGWPATIMPGDYPLRTGALALAGVLAVLFLLRSGARPARGLVQAAGVGGVLIVLALVASGTDAVAKPAFLSWQSWDPYDRPEEPVSVDYVWNSNYDGIEFPKKQTPVLRIKAEGPRRLYWRATTLDDYTGQSWDESLTLAEADEAEQIDVVGQNELLPPAAENEENWIRQDVTVEALRDRHLIGSAQPVRWRPGTDAPVQTESGDVVILPRSLRQDQRYTVWSFVPRAKPSQLNRFQGDYPDSLGRYLEVVYQPVPEWSAPGRSAQMAVFFSENEDNFEVSANKALYEIATGVTARARTPYQAVVALEAWFREGGGFTYDESPSQPLGGEPALVHFAQTSKEGYCQHYAGAMAAMLRFLGIPARVAAGFTSGTYDKDEKEWVVTDHNAHTWVEVWFPRFGWLPFDPTPERGQLAATYSPYAQGFLSGDAAEAAGSFLTDLSGFNPQLAERIRSAAQQGRPGLEGPVGIANPGGGGAVAAVRDRGPSLVLLVLLVLAGAFAAVVILKAVLRSLRFATRSPRGLAAAYRRDVVGYLADQGLDVPPSATLGEIGSTLDRYYAVDADRFVDDLALARFGPPAEAGGALRRARQELREVRRQLRRNIGALARVRGAASLRSLTL